MKSILMNFVLILAFFFVSGTNNAQTSPYQKSAINHLKKNLEYIASDKLEGRGIATRGIELASEFISQQLKIYNVQPFGDNGTYFQSFPILETNVDSETKLKVFYNDNNAKTFLIGEELYLSTIVIPSNNYSGIKSDIVFAGYGLSSSENNYDDYSDIDVKGKIVFVMLGIPSYLAETAFLEGYGRMYGGVKYKITNAEKHGATGIILIPSGWIQKHWQFMVKQATSPEFTLINDDVENKSDEGSIPAVYISEEVVRELLKDEKYSYNEIQKLANDDEILPIFNLSKKVVLDYKIINLVKTAKNVIGLIEGTDEKLKNEFVVLSAHYDHEGIINDEIYNGADDDGSGTVAILEAARRIAQDKTNKRSVLITFHTGEEEGLYGSQYLTSHSKYITDVIADINIDMVGRGSTDSIYSIGSNKLSTELHDLVEKTNDETVKFCFNYEFDDPADPNRYYYRSDHYNYAKHNIPIVFFYDHMTEDYHKPTDDVDKINFEKIEKISTLITELSHRIANLDHRLIIDKTDQ